MFDRQLFRRKNVAEFEFREWNLGFKIRVDNLNENNSYTSLKNNLFWWNIAIMMVKPNDMADRIWELCKSYLRLFCYENKKSRNERWNRNLLFHLIWIWLMKHFLENEIVKLPDILKRMHLSEDKRRIVINYSEMLLQ